MTDAELIAAHIAKHGITKCPPRAFAMPPMETWQQMAERQKAVFQRAKKWQRAAIAAAAMEGGPRDPKSVTLADIAEAIRQGRTLGQMSAMFGMTDKAIQHRLRRAGLSVTAIREAA